MKSGFSFGLAAFLLVFVLAETLHGQTNVTLRFKDGSRRVPVPDGFEPAPPQAIQSRAIVENQLGTNVQALLVLVSHEDAEGFRKTNGFSCKRSLIVGLPRGPLEKITTEDEFVRLKNAAIARQVDMGKYVRANSQNVASNVTELAKQDFNVNAGVTVGDMTWYPVHERSKRHWASSLSISVAVAMTNQTANPRRSAAQHDKYADAMLCLYPNAHFAVGSQWRKR